MCGKPIAFAVKGAVNKYCSYTCMNKDKEAPTYFCKNCGKEYKPKSSDRINYCSRECYFESIKVEYVDGYVEGSSCRVYFNKCLYCGKIKVSERAGKYCSDKCYRADSKEETRERSRNRNMELTDWDRVRTCAECGKKFTKESYGKKGLRCFCSEECARSANRRIRKNLKYKRRARVKEALVDRGITIEKLFVRDHGRCAICGRKLKISDVVPSKYAPTVDHIIPLSRGGKHAWYNVQLACFLCNSMKGDRSHGNGNRMMLPIKWLYVERGV
jgi:5-methylcytosine-specific restriction endonuclease McrA